MFVFVTRDARLKHLESRLAALEDDFIHELTFIKEQSAQASEWQDHNIAILANILDRKINRRIQTKRVRVKKKATKKTAKKATKK